MQTSARNGLVQNKEENAWIKIEAGKRKAEQDQDASG